MKKKEINDIETQLLLEAIYQRYGHDFRNYTLSTINRSLNLALQKSECETISGMTEKLLYDESFFHWLLTRMSISVTEWFRNPHFYKKLREKVIPYLKTFPFIKIWDAGCASGEEVYSLSIILKEENLYDRATIFAADFNNDALDQAQQGIYSIKNIETAKTNYQKTGEEKPIDKYFHTNCESGAVEASLKKNITFANHNLVTDKTFGEMNLILCRNVQIYFQNELKKQVFNLFHDSLIKKGFLCLGDHESMDFSGIQDKYKIVDKKQNIYQRIKQ